MTTLHMLPITEKTIKEITSHNSGVRPSDDYLLVPMCYVYAFNGRTPNEILSREDFDRKYRIVKPGTYSNLIEKI